MALILTIVIFFTIVMVIFSFGAAVYAPSSVIGSRLRSLGWQKAQVQPRKVAFKERVQLAMDPLSRAVPLSPSEVSRTRGWLIQAGYREPKHLTFYVGSRVLGALLGMAVAAGFPHPDILYIIGLGGLGFFIPRMILKRMVKARQRRITIGLPDALDLTAIQGRPGDAFAKDAVRRFGRIGNMALNLLPLDLPCEE